MLRRLGIGLERVTEGLRRVSGVACRRVDLLGDGGRTEGERNGDASREKARGHWGRLSGRCASGRPTGAATRGGAALRLVDEITLGGRREPGLDSTPDPESGQA